MQIRHLVLGVLVAAFAGSLLIGAHYYLALRLIVEPGWAEPFQRALLVGLVLMATTLVLAPICERLAPRGIARLAVWPGSIWMGLCFLLLTLLGVSDLVLWGIGEPARADTSVAGLSESGARTRALLSFALVLGAGAWGLRGGLREPELRRVEHRLARGPRELDGFRIVQISDLHIGAILGRRFAARLVERCNALHPDLVAVTGDLVDGTVKRLSDEVAPFAELRAEHGVFFVTGNHDHYSGALSWLERVRTLGMRPLRNECVTIEVRGAAFDLAGVDDHRGGYFDGLREDLPRALHGRNTERALVLLAHDPSTFKRASATDVDLQLSGHTHGGQIWPFAALVRLVIPFVAGVYERNGSRLYVSRGTGFWGPPMRLGAPAEITEHILRGEG